MRFAPSRFIGYKNNSKESHKISWLDGGETNRAIIKILKTNPSTNNSIEEHYIQYCHSIGLKISSIQRKYWQFDLGSDFDENINISSDFPEGRLVERAHKYRERDSEVVQLAKHLFREKHGKLHCQLCKFDFKNTYGKLGEDFIEGHHTLPVSEMGQNHRTKPEDIAMVCSNCHRMLH